MNGRMTLEDKINSLCEFDVFDSGSTVKIRTGDRNHTLTFFIDIDSTLLPSIFEDLEQGGKYLQADHPKYSEPLDNVRKTLNMLHHNGHKVILTTGRPETYRKFTEKQLGVSGLYYDAILFGLGTGARVVINDIRPEEPEIPTAVAVNLKPDGGFPTLDIVRGYEQ